MSLYDGLKYNTNMGKWILHTGRDNRKPCRLIYSIGPEHVGRSWPLVTTPIGSYKYAERRNKHKEELSWVIYEGKGRPYGSEKSLQKWKAQRSEELTEETGVPVHVIHYFFDEGTGIVGQ